MNFLCLSFLALLFSPLCGNLLFSQWVRTGGPGGGTVESIVSEKNLPGDSSGNNGQFLFATTEFGGVYRSGDDGKNWNPINTGFASTIVRRLCIVRDVLGKRYLFATSINGVFRTTNNGDIWENVNTGLPGNDTYGIAVDYSSTGITTLYVSVYGTGVYYSTNFGDVWFPTPQLQSLFVSSLAVWSDTSGNSILYAGTNGGIYISINGSGWAASNNGLTNLNITNIKIRSESVDSATIFITTFGGGVFRSADFGANWEQISTGLTNLSTYSLAVSDSNLFTTSFGDGVFRSTNSGANWFPANNNLDDFYTLAIEMHDSLLFIGSWGGGVFCSSDWGDNWSGYSNGLSASIVHALNVSGTNLFAGIWGGRGVFRFDKETYQWMPAQIGLSKVKVWSITSASDELGMNHVFAGTYYGGIFHSSDNGVSWEPKNTGLVSIDIPSFTSAPIGSGGSNIFAGTAGGVYLSTNYGGDWISSSSGITNLYIKSLHAYSDFAENTYILAGTYSGGIFVSSNNGTNWASINIGLTSYQINAITTAEDAQGNVYLFAGTSPGGIFLSTNGGTNWMPVNNGLTDNYVLSLTVIKTGYGGSNIVAGTEDGGVFISTDYGLSWTGINEGLDVIFKDIRSLAVFDQYLIAGTFAGGVWIRPLSEITSVETKQYNLPSQYILFQNYPNPFNPSTKISWQSPVGSWQTLKVYDVLGREIATLVDEFRNTGNYEIEFDATRLASGIYYYQLKAGSYIENKKMIYLK